MGARQMAASRTSTSSPRRPGWSPGEGLIDSTGFEFIEGEREAAAGRHRRGDPRHGPRSTRVADGRRRTAGSRSRASSTRCRRTPTPRSSSACAEAAKEAGADSFLAVGGGSVMDTAKAANVIFTHGGTVRDWEGFFDAAARQRRHAGGRCRSRRWRRSRRPRAPAPRSSFAAVIKDAPSTSSSRSATSRSFPTSRSSTRWRPRRCRRAIAAATGMDALTHAIEGYVSTEWNPHGDAFALHAIRLIRDNLERAVTDTSDDGGARQHARRGQHGDRPVGLGRRSGSRTRCRTRAAAHFEVAHGVANAINLPVGDRVQRRRATRTSPTATARSRRSSAWTPPGTARRSARRSPTTCAA